VYSTDVCISYVNAYKLGHVRFGGSFKSVYEYQWNIREHIGENRIFYKSGPKNSKYVDKRIFQISCPRDYRFFWPAQRPWYQPKSRSWAEARALPSLPVSCARWLHNEYALFAITFSPSVLLTIPHDKWPLGSVMSATLAHLDVLRSNIKADDEIGEISIAKAARVLKILVAWCLLVCWFSRVILLLHFFPRTRFVVGSCFGVCPPPRDYEAVFVNDSGSIQLFSRDFWNGSEMAFADSLQA
jgi:hypothetical protein